MVEIRPAQPDDALEVANVNVRAWRVGYRGLLPEADLEAMRPEDRAARYTFDPTSTDPAQPYTEVAVDDAGTIRGFVTTALSPSEETAGLGEVWAIYVDPPAWRTGVGSALLEHAHARLAEGLGATDAVLWMLAGNERAEAFYRRHGWVADGSARLAVVWGIEADERRLRRSLRPSP